MTISPHDSRQVVARLDLEPYELPGVCQWPDCSETHGLENHHLWRRTGDLREAWWVELPGGLVLPSRAHLCAAHHLPVTDNVVAIRYVETAGRFHAFTWESKTVGAWLGELEPCVGPQGGASRGTPGGTEAEGRSAMQLTVDGEEVPHDEVCDEHTTEETCPKCKGAGKVAKRKQRKATKGLGSPKVIATRVPATEEGGFERLKLLHDAAEAILVELGILKERGNGAAFYRDSAVYAEFIDTHRELLPADWKTGDYDPEEGEDE